MLVCQSTYISIMQCLDGMVTIIMHVTALHARKQTNKNVKTFSSYEKMPGGGS